MDLTTASTLQAYFREVLERAVANQRLHTTVQTTSYLVSLLSEFAAQPICNEALGLKMLESLAASSAERVAVLKEVGDTSLFVSGYFPESLNTTTFDVDYYVGIGQVAYGELGKIIGRSGSSAGSVFDELAAKFRAFVEVLSEISADGAASSPKEMLRLYERYLQTGNRSAARLLRTQGVFVPAQSAPHRAPSDGGLGGAAGPGTGAGGLGGGEEPGN